MGEQQLKHEYQNDFFDYLNYGSTASATVVCPLLIDWLQPASLLDVGCGAGAWCRVWLEQGVADVVGVDGDYVSTSSLLIPQERFFTHDLARTFDLQRKFELVTSLEVAEHLPEPSAGVFLENLARHGDRILFSAAVPGQGGEFHVNEQPLSYWRSRFRALGFRCFDPLRPRILADARVEPWYRYNTLLYVKETAVAGLREVIRETELSSAIPIPELTPLAWRTRNALLRNMPRPVVNALVQLKHGWMRRIRRSAH